MRLRQWPFLLALFAALHSSAARMCTATCSGSARRSANRHRLSSRCHCSTRSAHIDELTYVRGAVVMVQTGRSTHDGVLMDSAGMVLTTHIPADQKNWIAVSFDEKRSIPGRVIAEDEKNDASIVRINMEQVKDVVVPLVRKGAFLILQQSFIRFAKIPSNRSAGPAEKDSHSTSRAGHFRIPPLDARTISTENGSGPKTGVSDGCRTGTAE